VRPGPRREAVRTAPRPVPTSPVRRPDPPPVVVGAGPGRAVRRPSTLGAGSAPPPVVAGARQAGGGAGRDVARFWRTESSTPRATPSSGGGGGTFSDGKLTTRIGTRSWTTSSRRSRSSRDPGARQGRQSRTWEPTGSGTSAGGCARSSLPWASPSGSARAVEELSVSQGEVRGVRLAGAGRSDPPSSCSRRATRRAHGAAALRARRRDVGEGVRRRVPGGASPGDDRAGSSTGRWRGRDFPPLRSASRRASPSGRGVFSFCMCPGGEVMNAASGEGQSPVNGMSARAATPVRNSVDRGRSVGPGEFGRRGRGRAAPWRGSVSREEIERPGVRSPAAGGVRRAGREACSPSSGGKRSPRPPGASSPRGSSRTTCAASPPGRG